LTDRSGEQYGPPRLSRDGVTILLPMAGHTDDGIYYDGYREVHPGDPDYARLLPAARENAVADTPPERGPDPYTLARIRRETGRPLT
jgi:hypothetical protein